MQVCRNQSVPTPAPKAPKSATNAGFKTRARAAKTAVLNILQALFATDKKPQSMLTRLLTRYKMRPPT